MRGEGEAEVHRDLRRVAQIAIQLDHAKLPWEDQEYCNGSNS